MNEIKNPKKPGEIPPSREAHVYHGVAPVVHFSILVVATAALVISVLCYVKVKQVATISVRQTASVGDIVKKLTAHPEAQPYFSTPPVGIVQIDQNNIQNLQNQIRGLDVYTIGNHLIQWPNALFMYNYAQDKILAKFDLQPPMQGPPPGAPPAQPVGPPHPATGTQQVSQATPPPQTPQPTQQVSQATQQVSQVNQSGSAPAQPPGPSPKP